ncbi:hypothetical protein [Hyalangium versicolor]|uniref:hypothetical protein n=1 Tax=Hyalangium versicolor TaxID=2861190 RepID=UPI001CC94D45|nr:hypothetical protein [Hyalangium versicolor]
MDSAESPAVLITVTGGREEDRGILVAWPEGLIIWSDDRVRGGPPYRSARIDPVRIRDAVSEMVREGPWTGVHRHAPDSRWTHVVARSGSDIVVDVGSWHELLEANPRIVATATGAEPLDERTRAEVHARQPPEYQSFLRRWEHVTKAALSLIPPSGQLVGEPERARMPWLS